MYENIIIGYDGSASSVAAVRHIAAGLSRYGGHAKIVHGVYFDEEEFGIQPEMLRKRTAAGTMACREAQKIAADLGVDMPVVVREGEPPLVITALAREEKADLIALGTHGRRGIKRLIMGSVTAKVILDAPCDVLVIKAEPGREHPEPYKAVLVPFDGSPASRKAMQTACLFAEKFGAAITVLYVIPRYEEMLNFFKTESVRASLNQEAEKILDVARTLATEHQVAVQAVIKEGNAADNIVETAEGGGHDLIVMGSSGWRGLDKSIMGSTAERVIMAANGPVLVTR